MMAVILNSAMLDSDTLFSSLRFTPKHSHSTLTLTQTNSIWLKLIHSDSTWWWQPSWILPSWIPPSWIQHLSFSSQTHSLLPRLVPTICTKKTFTHSFWLNLMMAVILNFTMLDSDICHLGFSHLSFSSQTLSHLPWLVPTICTKKKPSLIHSDSTWWCQPSWILPCWIKKLHSFILTQLDDGSHLEFCHVGFRHLVFFSQIHS